MFGDKKAENLTQQLLEEQANTFKAEAEIRRLEMVKLKERITELESQDPVMKAKRVNEVLNSLGMHRSMREKMGGLAAMEILADSGFPMQDYWQKASFLKELGLPMAQEVKDMVNESNPLALPGKGDRR